MSVDCPFCQQHPYHYVHNGVGLEPVAIVCCELGSEFFQTGGNENVTRHGNEILDLRRAQTAIQDQIDRLIELAESESSQ